ncbi:TonB-dependent receptor [Fusobacterium necrophorum]|uniref:TonB-dependent receptor n=1 Tax=Fusobacterium necrophorum TaxID=859 RepID=UPI003FA03482
MKKEMILTLLCFASLQAMAATQEVELKPTKIHGGGATFSGSVLSGERKNTVIITDKDIEKKQYKNITEIFEDSPLTIVTHTPAGPVVALRGSGEKTIMRVKVLVDGNSMTSIDESMGVIPFNSIPAGSIKRIEIIPGGGITLYGSGSSSGVINIVTKMGEAKDYGSVNVSAGSFDTYKVEVSKGIRISPHLFSNVSVEAKKGKGYRELEEEERVNVMGGLNIDINPRHRMRLSGSYFHENAEGTNEAFLSEIKKNRKHPGDTLAKTKSKRYTAGIDYEYTPTENLTFTAGVNESKLTRDIKADAHPHLVFLPGGRFLSFLTPNGYALDPVAENLSSQLKGSIEEEIKNAKLKTEYRYKNNQGKLIFGADYNDHRIRRELDIQSEPFSHENHMKFLITKKGRRDFSLEELKEGERIYGGSELLTFNFLMSNMREAKTENLLGKFLYPLSSKESQEKYDKGGGISSFMTDENFKLNLWKAGVEFQDYKVHDLMNFVEKDGKKGVWVNKQGHVVAPDSYWAIKFIEIPEDLKVKDFYSYLSPEAPADFKMANFVNSKVNVKKKTNAFYLYNSYPITERFNINAGLRYEKAKYKGYRESEAILHITGNPELESTGNYLMGYLNLSTGEDNLLRYFEKVGQKLEELKKDGKTQIVMSKLRKEIKKEEDNLGGEIGFDYKINDTDVVYAKYERAFNTPLPNQLTNKSIHPVHKVKMYWESGLQTEKMNNFEIGVRGAIGNNITYGLSGFLSNTYDEIITIVKDGNSHATREWRFINLDKTQRIGLELQSEQIFDKLKLRESITYVEPKVVLNRYEEKVKKIVKERVQEEKMAYRNGTEKHLNIYFDIQNPQGLSKENIDILKENYKPLVYDTMDEKITIPEAQQKIKDMIIPKLQGLDETKKNAVQAELGAFVYSAVRNYQEYTTSLEEVYSEFNGAGSNIQKGDRIPLAPKVKATFGADYQVTDSLKLGMNTTYIGSYITAEPDRIYSIVKTKVPSHWVADFYGTYELNDSFSLKFGVNNAFNHKYYLRQDSKTALPAAGRTYTAGFSYRF